MDSALGGSPPEREPEDESARLESALSCGPQCASSVLATRYAKILRQERLLAQARTALADLEQYAKPGINTGLKANWEHAAKSAVERSRAIRQEIEEERGNPA